MRDPNLFLQLAVATVAFTAIAVFAGRATTALSRRARMRPPPPALVLVTRAWFALLAMACVALMIFRHSF